MDNINKTKKLILGTAQMGLDYGINNFSGKIDINESYEILKYAFLNGINHIDCAESYGDIHKIIGEFRDLNPNFEFNLHTKISSVDSKINLTDTINRLLKSTKINRIKSLMFHSLSYYKEGLELIDVLLNMKRQGLIDQLGVSVYSNDEIQNLIYDNSIDLIQLPFNMLDNSEFKIDLIKEAKHNGKTIQARSVFLQGLFFKNPEEDNIVVKKLKNELVQINKISECYKIPLNEMALNYVLSHDFIDHVIIGVDSLIQLKKNLNSLKTNLHTDILEQIKCIEKNNVYFLNPKNW